MKKKRSTIWLIVLILLVSVFIDLPSSLPLKFNLGKLKVAYTLSRPDIDFTLGPLHLMKQFRTRFGLDLSGGTHLVLEAQMQNITKADRNTALDSAKNIIEKRVNLFGVSEPVVQSARVGDAYRILVELPGIKDINTAIDLIGKTAQLDFRAEATDAAKLATSSGGLVNVWTRATGLSGKYLRRSEVTFDPNTGKPQVGLEFDSVGAKIFETVTRDNTGKTLAIFLDNMIISAPRVNEAISGGRAVISGNFTLEEAKNLSISLNAGALPVPIKIVEQRNIGATLGQESIDKSILAGVIGLFIVVLFMIYNYGKFGVMADLALILYSLLVFAIFKYIPVTLTLAGIAGFILSIGMAVDANILIFERMREEERSGKSRTNALDLGFARAFPSIRDSNVSSLITCAILYWFGSGMVRGFAVTLAIGILVSLFSAITVTRTLLRSVIKN